MEHSGTEKTFYGTKTLWNIVAQRKHFMEHSRTDLKLSIAFDM